MLVLLTLQCWICICLCSLFLVLVLALALVVVVQLGYWGLGWDLWLGVGREGHGRCGNLFRYGSGIKTAREYNIAWYGTPYNVVAAAG